MTHPRPDVTVIVVPREQFSMAGRALEVLFERARHPFSLIYVDGGSPRAVHREILASARRWGFTLIRTTGYLTPNAARNLALARVDSRYVVFLDNDVMITANAIEAMVQCAEETGAAVVGPVTCIGPPECEVIHSAGGLAHVDEHHGRRRLVHENHFEHSRYEDVGPRLRRTPTELVEFHCVLVRTEMLARIGLDEGILNDPHHMDFCMMVREAGGRIYLEPSAVVTQFAPPPVRWPDLPFFLQRWNGPATRRSLRHFTRKWRLPADDPSVERLAEWLVTRRRLAFRGPHGLVKRALGWKIGTRFEHACLRPLEALVSGLLFYALRNRGTMVVSEGAAATAATRSAPPAEYDPVRP